MTLISAWCTVASPLANISHSIILLKHRQMSELKTRNLEKHKDATCIGSVNIAHRRHSLQLRLPEGLVLFPPTVCSLQHRCCSPGEQQGHHSGHGQGHQEPSRRFRGPHPPGSQGLSVLSLLFSQGKQAQAFSGHFQGTLSVGLSSTEPVGGAGNREQPWGFIR